MITLFGGSFDPPHNGHKNLIEEFYKFFPNNKKLIIVPNFISPFKIKKSASQFQVLIMLDLFVKNINYDIKISNFEIKQTKPNYTINTILYFKKKYPNEEFFFLLGEDHLEKFHLWKDYKEILNLVKLVFFKRYKDKKILIPEYLQDSFFLKNRIYEISSSEIQKNIFLNQKNLDPAIFDFIQKEKIYSI